MGRVEILEERPLVLTIEGFLSAQECNTIIELAESLGFAEAPINTSGGEVMVKEIRDNSRAMTDDPELAQMLWTRLRP